MNILICDDDITCRLTAQINIERWVKEHSRNDQVILFDNGDSLLEYLEKQSADIIFLDIIMPLLSGMETAHIIRERSMDVKLVFLTSAPEFAVESYDVNAFGYLLKPVEYSKLSLVLDRFLTLQKEEAVHLTVRTAYGYKQLNLDNLECLEALGKKVVFHMFDGSKVETTGKFSDYEKMLTEDNRFFKIHRSYLVGLAHIDRFSSGEVVTSSGLHCPIARGLGSSFKEAYFSLISPSDK
ncbi:MAG: LytTR family DNA-binding domain-containing protein [Lachnospiraceae bacterium]|nr:LytTR family DNA-binding domain-containing protein [Lachnospiraceae bacterium]